MNICPKTAATATGDDDGGFCLALNRSRRHRFQLIPQLIHGSYAEFIPIFNEIRNQWASNRRSRIAEKTTLDGRTGRSSAGRFPFTRNAGGIH